MSASVEVHDLAGAFAWSPSCGLEGGETNNQDESKKSQTCNQHLEGSMARQASWRERNGDAASQG